MGVIHNKADIDELKKQVAAIGDVTELTTTVETLDETVNGDGTTTFGLVGDVATLDETVNGDGATTFGLVGDVATLDETVNGDGSTTTGLVGQVADIETALENISAGVDYSMSEQDTGLKWIDGKTIYQRTFDLGTGLYEIPNTSYYTSNISITNLSQIITAFAIKDLQTFPLIAEVGNPVVLKGTADRGMYARYITLQYTKTS